MGRREAERGSNSYIGCLCCIALGNTERPILLSAFPHQHRQERPRALAETGFVDVNATSVPLILSLDRATGFIDAVLNGTVRAKALLLAQDDAVLSTISTAVAQAVARLFRSEKGFRVPMPAVVGSGAKPEV